MKVLVVDDNRELAANLGEVLEDEGLEVTVAHEAAMAHRAVDTEPGYQWALVDICLGRDSGVALARRLQEKQPALRLALMTAYARDEVLADADDLDVSAVFPKPVPLAELLGMLRP